MWHPIIKFIASVFKCLDDSSQFFESIPEKLRKILKVTLFFVDFSMAFDSIHREIKEQIFLAYGFPKETVTIIMMLYKNRNAILHLPNGITFLWHGHWSLALVLFISAQIMYKEH